MRTRVLLLLLLGLLLGASPAWADFQTAVGHFGTTTQAATNTVQVTGLGFQPKIVFFFWNGRTESTDAVGSRSISFGFGAATSSTDRRCVTAGSRDAVGTTDARTRKHNDSVIVIIDFGVGTGQMDLQSMDAGGFTLVIDVAFTQDYRIGYLALGGSDITNVATGSFDVSTATGDISVTGPGFQPDTVLIFADGTNSTTENGDLTNLLFTLGAAAGSPTPTNAVVAVSSDGNAAVSLSRRQAHNSASMSALDPDGTVDAWGSVTAWTASGFTFNVANAHGSGTQRVYYAAIKGGKYAVGDFLTQTDTVTDIVESGFGFSPSAVFTATHHAAEDADSTATTHLELSLGAGTSASNRLALTVLDENGLETTETAAASEFDAIIANLSASDAIEGLVDYKSKDSDGFTFINDDADPAQSFAWFWAAGPAAAPAGNRRCLLLGVC